MVVLLMSEHGNISGTQNSSRVRIIPGTYILLIACFILEGVFSATGRIHQYCFAILLLSNVLAIWDFDYRAGN